MSSNWADLYADGRRLNRVIRRLEKKLKICEDIDKLIKLSNSIGYLTDKKVELVDRCLGVKAILKAGEKNHPQEYKERYNQNWMKEVEK